MHAAQHNQTANGIDNLAPIRVTSEEISATDHDRWVVPSAMIRP